MHRFNLFILFFCSCKINLANAYNCFAKVLFLLCCVLLEMFNCLLFLLATAVLKGGG